MEEVRVLMMKRGVIVADEAIGTILHLPWCVITDVDLETIDLEHTQVRMQRPDLTIENRTRIFHLLDIISSKYHLPMQN